MKNNAALEICARKLESYFSKYNGAIVAYSPSHQNISEKKLWDKVSTEGKLDPQKIILTSC